jgi:hypothetical protein
MTKYGLDCSRIVVNGWEAPRRRRMMSLHVSCHSGEEQKAALSKSSHFCGIWKGGTAAKTHLSVSRTFF